MNLQHIALSISLVGIMASMIGYCEGSPMQPPTRQDYAFMWWAYGYRGESPKGEQILCIQTGNYGLAVDVNKAAVTHLGAIKNSLTYEEAAAQDNEAVFSLPSPRFRMRVKVGDKIYTCIEAASDKSAPDFPIRIIDSGRYVQRFDILQLKFKDAQRNELPADGRFEVIAWPDRIAMTCEITPKQNLTDAEIVIELDGRETNARKRTLRAGIPSSVTLAWAPDKESLKAPYQSKVEVSVLASENNSDAPLKVASRYNQDTGYYSIEMPTPTWQITTDPDRLDRYRVNITNPTDSEQVFRLCFSYDKIKGRIPNLPGIVGMSPMLQDADRNPTGIPIQISKNWHKQPNDERLYEGPWFHGYTMIRIAPRSRWEGEYNVAYAHWGGLPAISHSQLCLIGWGVNQVWDEMAMGSGGESICYDPDVNLQRSMIDDVRPLMVSSDGKPYWGFTNNVGGGDFLVYFDGSNKKQFLSRVRTAYLQHGPNLSKVIYAGISPDGCITARISASSPRSDDVNRAYYHLRYDVLKPMPFSRLAFFQLGADNYNDHQFKMIARGNIDDGLVEEWQTEQGGLKYIRQGIVCQGNAPWISLHGALPYSNSIPNSGWANRGLIIRSWKARLGGKEIPVPHVSIYGSHNGVPSALLELAPPPGLDRLQPGDYVEADLEMVIVPVSADEYFGPNENLRKHLKSDANTWKVIDRLARGNAIKVSSQRGTLKSSYPVVVAVDHDIADITVTGGVGYVPVTFTGLKDHNGYRLCIERNGERTQVDQSVHGNDFWQTDFNPKTKTFSRTYNISLDSPNDIPVPVRLILDRG